ncbi:MAG TPA: hypothetical protein VF712_07465 [Thermoleophilaceae bacterium]
MIGFVLFALAGFVFGYAAPKAWAILPVLLPIVVGVYTGLMDTFDSELIVLIAVGVGVTILGIVLGRMLLYSLEGRSGSRSRTA